MRSGIKSTFKKKIYVRLDDACPWMDHDKWDRIIDILDRNEIKPLIGIIPQNLDSQTRIKDENPDFWNKMTLLASRGYSIALHGFDHRCVTDCGGVNPVHQRSEFAGLPLNVQREKIRKGIAIFESHGLTPKYFFAPSHTFDANTLVALEKESEIRLICDTFKLYPYKLGDFTVIPQQMGSFRHPPLPGSWVFCFHPNNMKDSEFEAFESFIRDHRELFHDFNEFDECAASVSLLKRVVNYICFKSYLFFRKII